MRRKRSQGKAGPAGTFRFGRSPLLSAAEWICDRLHTDRSGEKLGRELMELGTGKKNCVREYYVRKTERMLLLIAVSAAALAGIFIAEHRRSRTVTGGLLDRPGYGEGSTDQSLYLQISGEEESEYIDIHLAARTYTKAQARALLEKAEEELAAALPGDNPSMDEIRSPLRLPEQLQEGAVTAEYRITPSGMIGDDGAVIGDPEAEGTIITVSAVLSCQSSIRTYECAARVFPPVLTEQEQLRENIRSAVEDAQTESPSDPQLQLPEEVDGRRLRWSYPRSSSVRMLIVLLLLFPAAYWAHEDTKVHDAAKERRAQLELDYSQLLWKLMMLLSAGLTIRGSFTRITDQYAAENGRRYVYEEMLLTLREMHSGVPEAAAYENFGRRCGLPSYVKLGSLLSQNLKKGSKGLTGLLEHEAALSLEMHKMAVRRLGERAAIRMLLPMILMFGVVLVVLMVPAFLSM